MFRIIIAFLLLGSSFVITTAYGQDVQVEESALLDKITLYSKAHPSACLFVHSDKTVYTNNEEIWFSAYLLKTSSLALEDHNVLSVAVIAEGDRKVYLQEKFAIEQGVEFGEYDPAGFHSPWKLPAYGNYQCAR